VLERPSAASSSAVAEACVAGGESGTRPCPCQVGPFGTWAGAVPWVPHLLAKPFAAAYGAGRSLLALAAVVVADHGPETSRLAAVPAAVPAAASAAS